MSMLTPEENEIHDSSLNAAREKSQRLVMEYGPEEALCITLLAAALHNDTTSRINGKALIH